VVISLVELPEAAPIQGVMVRIELIRRGARVPTLASLEANHPRIGSIGDGDRRWGRHRGPRDSTAARVRSNTPQPHVEIPPPPSQRDPPPQVTGGASSSGINDPPNPKDPGHTPKYPRPAKVITNIGGGDTVAPGFPICSDISAPGDGGDGDERMTSPTEEPNIQTVDVDESASTPAQPIEPQPSEVPMDPANQVPDVLIGGAPGAIAPPEADVSVPSGEACAPEEGDDIAPPIPSAEVEA